MARFSKKHYEFLAAFLAYERSVSTGKNWDADTQRTATIDGLRRTGGAVMYDSLEAR